MKWKIVTDSGSNLRKIDHLSDEIAFDLVPLILTLNGEELIDDAAIDTKDVVKKMKKDKHQTTACPAPGVYADKFDGADNVICFTLSNEVSGSYNSAKLAKKIALEKNPQRKIHIFNSKSAGGEMDLLISKAIEFIEEGKEFNELIDDLNNYHEHTLAAYMLQSIDNLVKNGRVNKIVGSLVGLLNINILGIRSEKGEIEMSDRVRGVKRSLKRFIKDMTKHDINGQKIEISHVNNKKLAQKLADKLIDKFPEADINIRPTSGLCSFYAEDNGLIVGFERD